MKTSLTVTGSSADGSVSVHLDTEVTHRRGATSAEVQSKAVTKMKTFLKRYNPEVLPQLVQFSSSDIATVKP